MGQKTFQQILDEQLGRQKREPTLPITREKQWTPPIAEFDFSALRAIRTAQLPKEKAMAAYPKATPTPVKAPTAKPRPKEKLLEVAALSSAEYAALHALGIKAEPFLSKTEVKTKYRALVRKLHPDHHPIGINETEKTLLTEKFQLIHEAYEILGEAFGRQIPKQQ